MVSDSVAMKLVGSMLLHDDDVAPGGDGLALAVGLFSERKFRELLGRGRAHEAFAYLIPFLRKELTSLQLDGKVAEPQFWELHDDLMCRALVDAKRITDDVLSVYKLALESRPVPEGVFSLISVGKVASVKKTSEDDRLVELLQFIPTMQDALEEGRKVDASPREELADYVRRAEAAFKHATKLKEEAEELREQLINLTKQHDKEREEKRACKRQLAKEKEEREKLQFELREVKRKWSDSLPLVDNKRKRDEEVHDMGSSVVTKAFGIDSSKLPVMLFEQQPDERSSLQKERAKKRDAASMLKKPTPVDTTKALEHEKVASLPGENSSSGEKISSGEKSGASLPGEARSTSPRGENSCIDREDPAESAAKPPPNKRQKQPDQPDPATQPTQPADEEPDEPTVRLPGRARLRQQPHVVDNEETQPLDLPPDSPDEAVNSGESDAQRSSGKAVLKSPTKPSDVRTRLTVHRNILYIGCCPSEPKPNMRVFPDLTCGIHHMMQYISKSKEGDDFEVLLVLQRSGRIVCFKRPWITTSPESPQRSSPAALASKVTLVGPESGVLAGVERVEADKPPSMVRLGNLDKIVVCIDENVCMYESHLERFASGLKVETKLERAFKARLPPLIQSSNARSIAHHPVDKNLYAVSTGDAKILVQSFHLHDQFQTISGSGPPPLIEFSTSGNLFISVATVMRQGGLATVHLQTRNVPEASLAPHSNAVVRREDCVDLEDFRRKKAEEKAKNKDALEKWVEKYQTQNRGSTLLQSDCYDSAELPQGMPVRIVPVRKQVGRQYEDFALLSWPTEIEVWKLRPVEKVAWRKMIDCTCTAVFAFHMQNGRQYWLVGTSQAQLYVISAWNTTKEKELKDVKIVDVLPVGSAPKAITAISTLNDVRENLLPHVLLYIGYADGSVNAYSMDELLGK
mmetsp:Transcript_60376/g.106951  ORF Transcript_60376/g.106951 Transcript_60376/m.106951 type:complete len:917 (+) Transcript_60376:202-2952(+)